MEELRIFSIDAAEARTCSEMCFSLLAHRALKFWSFNIHYEDFLDMKNLQLPTT